MMAPLQQGAHLMAEFVFPHCVFYIITNVMLGGRPNAGSILSINYVCKKHALKRVSMEFHEHLILLMWRNFYELREETVSRM